MAHHAFDKLIVRALALPIVLSGKLDEVIPSSKIVRGHYVCHGHTHCDYSIDRKRSAEACGKCIGLLNRKPPCQKKCKSNAIIWDGDRMFIDSNKCINCGKCGEVCFHYVIMHKGKRVGLTTLKTLRLVGKGLAKGLLSGICT